MVLENRWFGYTLTIANAGPSEATDVLVTDVPANLTITAVAGSGASASCLALPCTFASLASGANTTITVTAKGLGKLDGFLYTVDQSGGPL